MVDHQIGDPIPLPARARPEAEITAGWTATEPPVVSILCHTYNHASVLRDALNGFMMQETRFPFEIIVHDDASTDNTKEITRNYQERYPNIIRCITQKNNIYSKGLKPLHFTLPLARGMLIALCEGDDFWIDCQKIQRQVDLLAAHPCVDLCFHRSIIWFVDHREIRELSQELGGAETVIGAGRLLRESGNICHTSSLMIRKSALKDLPQWFWQAPAGDILLKVFGAQRGGALHLPDVMSVYRKGGSGSWSDQMREPRKMLHHLKRSVRTYRKAKGRFGGNISDELDAAIRKSLIRMIKISYRYHNIYYLFYSILSICVNHVVYLSIKSFRTKSNS